MKKILVVFLFSIILITNCYSPHRIYTSLNLFPVIDQKFPLKDLHLVVKTKDSVYYLSDAFLFNNNIIEATPEKVPSEIARKMSISSSALAQDVIIRMTDTAGNNRILFSNKNITEVSITDTTKTPAKQLIYSLKSEKKGQLGAGIVMLIVLTIIGVIAIIISIINNFMENISGIRCYIATMVYGSYNAPEVVVLRRFRDEKLAKTFMGKIFIGMYYTFSPLFVKVFQNNTFVTGFIKSKLDKWVNKLMEQKSK